MVAVNMTMLNTLSLIFGAGFSPNNNGTVQLQHDSKMSQSADYGDKRPCGCHDQPHECPYESVHSCHDPCVLDPPEVCIDPLKGISWDDPSLKKLINLTFPLRDVPWFLDGVKRLELETGPEKPDSLTDEEKEAVQEFIREYQLQTIIDIENNDTTQAKRNALIAGEELLTQREALDLVIRKLNITFDQDAPTLKHQLAFRRTDPISIAMAKLGIITEGATLNFSRAFDIPSVSASGLSLLGPIPGCEDRHGDRLRPRLVECPNPSDRYRTLDGSCNNVIHKLWGAAFRSYRRLLPADYFDGVSTFRKSVAGNALPSARFVSSIINNRQSEKSPSFSILQASFGIFIDHDIAATAKFRGSFSGYPEDESPIKCCYVPPPLHKECAPIDIPLDDPFYARFGETCMEFVRAAPAGRCHIGPRNQINQITSYIDASVVYGVKLNLTNSLRTFEDGLLKGQVIGENEFLLPPDMNPNDGCNRKENMAQGEYCFLSGDHRTNIQIQITFLHTLWAREHNRVAGILKESNSNWDDEKLFQETRRIVGAELQQVAYNEFLPTILSPALMSHLNLNPLTGSQQTDDYNDKLNSALANSFPTAAYRMGHSLIADDMLYINKQGQVTTNELSTVVFNPFYLYQRGAMCDIARGGIASASLKMDPYFTLQLAGKLFCGSKPFGLDLVALNIQRGRDHGLQPYNKWRELCGLPKAQTFDELFPEINRERIERLKVSYQNVNDIDLYAGGVSETAVTGGILGHTFTCIISDQFVRAKLGDRYWFEYKNGPGAFTRAQIQQLHRVTLAKMMCNNLPGLQKVQRWPLRNLDPENPKVCCKSIRQYNLDPWKPHYVEEEEEEEKNHDECY